MCWQSPGWHGNSAGPIKPQDVGRSFVDLTDDPDLIATLCGQWGDMGLAAKAIAVHGACDDRSALPVWRLLPRWRLLAYRGDYHPEDPGGRRRGLHLCEGQRRSSSRTAKCYGCRDEGRSSHRGANCVISSAGIDNTFNHLLPADIARAQRLHTSDAKGATEHPLTSVCISACRERRKSWGLPRTNFWIYPSQTTTTLTPKHCLKATGRPVPGCLYFVPVCQGSLTTRIVTRAHRPIEIVAPAPYEWFEGMA